MRHAQRQDGQRFLPCGGGEASFGDGLTGDIQPDDFKAEQQAVAAHGRLAAFQDVGDAPGDGVADAVSIGDRLAGLGGALELPLQFHGIGLMDQLPEKPGPEGPGLRGNAGQLLDVRAGKLHAEIRPLAEHDARPAAGHAFQARLGAEQAHEHLAAGGIIVQMFVPGGFLQFGQGRQGGVQAHETGFRAAHDFEQEPLRRLLVTGKQFQFQTVEGVLAAAHPAQGGLPLGGERGEGFPKGLADQTGGGFFEPAAERLVDLQDAAGRGQQRQPAFQPAPRRGGGQGRGRDCAARDGFRCLKVSLHKEHG